MEDQIREKGQKLLKTHLILGEKLEKIPQTREMIFRIDEKNGLFIGKPRFKPPRYIWGEYLLGKLLDHLQNIWIYLRQHYYYFDRQILESISKETRRRSKYSVLFLLERGIWATDEVYGDYLIEKTEDTTTVSYFRRDEKRESFVLATVDDDKIKQWICEDAVDQIIKEFHNRWDLLYTEIDTCAIALHIRVPTEIMSDQALKDQISDISNILKIDHISAMLSLGRAAELWCLVKLGQREKHYSQHYIQDLKQAGVVNDHEGRLLNQIRINYNSIKHKTDFEIEVEEVVLMYDAFTKLVGLLTDK